MQQGWHNTVMKGMNMDELWCLLLLEDVVSTEWHWSGWMLAVGPWWRLSMAVLHSFNFSPCCVKTESIHSRTMPEEIVKAILAGRYSVKRCDFPALVSLLTTESTHRKRQHATDFYGVSWYDLWWCVFSCWSASGIIPAVSFEHHDNWVVQHVLDSWSCTPNMSIFSQSEDVRLYVCPLSWPWPFWIWRGKNMFRDPKGLSLKTTQKVTRNQLQSLIQETEALLPRRSPDQWSSDSTQDMWSKHISKTGVRTYINYTSWLDQRHPSPRNPKKSFRRRHDIYLHPATITYIYYTYCIYIQHAVGSSILYSFQPSAFQWWVGSFKTVLLDEDPKPPALR